MRCTKARRLISDSLDGQLHDADWARLKKHVGGCAECREILHDFQGIVNGAQALETPSPSDETWAAILEKLRTAENGESSVRPEKSRWSAIIVFTGKWKYAVSALLVLAVVIGGIMMGWKSWGGKRISQMSVQQRFTLEKLQEAERHYQLAVKALTEAITSQKGSLNPQVAEVFQSDLEAINLTIEACQDAVRREPNNFEARIYLLSAYKEKVNFLDGLMEMKRKSPAGNGQEKSI
ncbi:MAG: zf-HC2 domain-containing protein [Candidatus Aminicenantales bacterium]